MVQIYPIHRSVVLLICLIHSCFSHSVKCGGSTMENGFQVTILDLEALES